jgi:hypothetical protein
MEVMLSASFLSSRSWMMDIRIDRLAGQANLRGINRWLQRESITDFEEYESVTIVSGVFMLVTQIAAKMPKSSALWIVCISGNVVT